MRQLLALLLLPLLFAQDSSLHHRVNLPTSKVLNLPSPGYLSALNGFTPTVALSPDGRFAAFLNDGYGTEATHGEQSISVLDLRTNELASFPDARFGEDAKQSYFIGLAFSSDGTELYASVGSISDPIGTKAGDLGNGIAAYTFRNGEITPERFLKISPQPIAAGKSIARDLNNSSIGERNAIPYPAGLAIVPGKPDKLLVANNLSDTVVLLNTEDGSVLRAFDLSTNKIVPNSYPHSVVVSRDGKRAWCSLWNASRIAEIDLEGGKVKRMIPVLAGEESSAPGSHPTAMLLSYDEKVLYVALSNADKVAAIHAGSGEILRLLNTRMPGQQYGGATPVSLAQSQDGERLYVSDASLDAVAVFDHPASASSKEVSPSGMIPTDWYPTALAVVGSDLLIATSKGKGTGPNAATGSGGEARRHHGHIYIATLLYGSLARIHEDEIQRRLQQFTREAEDANLLNGQSGQAMFAGSTNPIRHVIYVLKENRTYDQILGDLRIGNEKIGNGDSSLTLYGADITPNLHKLALQFGVLDNFYDSGEVSGDGHVWSTAATTTDYNENTWQIAYRGRERTYDFQGNVSGESPLEQNRPDIDAPSTGFLWDNLAAHHLTYRDYGEFVDGVWCRREPVASPKQGMPSPLEAKCASNTIAPGSPLPSTLGEPRGSASPWPWDVPMFNHAKAAKASLRDHFDPNYPDFETSYPDQLRADEFLNEFAGFVAAKNKKPAGNGAAQVGELPQFVLLYLPDDHTGGTRSGKPRPAASVADNDLAVGRVVDAVSHSPYWEDTAIFVIEDDAQDGADHVDAHRSIALAISKYSPGSSTKPFVDSSFYTTVNMLHTIESLLGLPPMNQNDGYAPAMAPLFTGTGTQPAFTADYGNRENHLIYQMNSPKTEGAKESSKLDFSHPDANNARQLNEILWHDRKGRIPMPAAQHKIISKSAEPDRD